MSDKAVVGIIMGSRSDWSVMEAAADTLASLGVPFEAKVVSAHQPPSVCSIMRELLESVALKLLLLAPVAQPTSRAWRRQ